MWYYLMLHYYGYALVIVARFNFALFDVVLMLHYLILHYLLLHYVNVPLLDVAP